jgi:ABC-type sugar transport system ATPase subunit
VTVQNETPAGQPLVALRGITKAFPGVVALDNVDLTLYAGEVLALTGENGSGKSTLSRVINGSVQPDAGAIIVDGVERTIPDPRTALRLGFVTISQELTLAPTLSVAENIFLGRLPRTGGRGD